MTDVAMVEALTDMGMEPAEIAADLGCDVADVERALGIKREPEIKRPGGSGMSPGRWHHEAEPTGSEPEMGHLARLAAREGPLVSWTLDDSRLVGLCDQIGSPGKMASVKVGGRLISRAGLVRRLAEEMCEIKLGGRRLLEVPMPQQRALVGMAILSVEALSAVQEAGR